MRLYSCWSAARSADVSASRSADVSDPAPRACAVLDGWRHGISWQRSAVRFLLPCICALREKENFQLFHFVQPLKMVQFALGTLVKTQLGKGLAKGKTRFWLKGELFLEGFFCPLMIENL